ncbi:MAG: hypothetical protein M3R12_10950 [Actinomycetota bacterium]|nr:hypothetical protein [Actinomycetota bacterium]
MHTTSRRRVGFTTLVAAGLVALVVAATALAAAPRNTAPPTLDGTFRQGQTIRTSNGEWANNPSSFSYRWLRCDNKNCARIGGATENRYRLVQNDVGKSIVSEVTARNGDGSATARSAFSPVVADNVAPQNSSPPRITGTATVGATLTADPGTWTGAPSFRYSWLRCDTNGANCTDTSARGQTYGVRADDLGRTLRVQVRATNARGSADANSAQTAVVRAGSSGSGPAVPVTSVSLPDRLVISAVSFSPTAIRNRNDTVTLNVRVNDTRGRLVSGALVLASGVPFGRITNMPETATNSNGIATLTFRPTARLAIQGNTAVQIFLRARKPGDNVLAGVSSRRLVQIRIVPG